MRKVPPLFVCIFRPSHQELYILVFLGLKFFEKDMKHDDVLKLYGFYRNDSAEIRLCEAGFRISCCHIFNITNFLFVIYI